jgi:peptidoglycan/LPS O-acetylase OafA/YrhL
MIYNKCIETVQAKNSLSPVKKYQHIDVIVKKYQYIDIIRALAILGVLATHSFHHITTLTTVTVAIFNYGQLGVQLFFLASAITLCLSASERKEDGKFNFYIRRFFRIAPLYYFGILLYFFWRCAYTSYLQGEPSVPQDYTLLHVLENILFFHGFDPSNFHYVVPGGWTIATEMAFYITFPFIFLLLIKLSLRSFIVFAIAIAVLSFYIQYISIEIIQPILIGKGIQEAVITNDEFGFIYASIINQINVFMIGIIAFKFLHKKITTSHLLIAMVLIFISCLIQYDRSYDTGYDGFFYIIMSSIAFVILIIKLSTISLPKNIICKVLTEAGQNSFSIYILHFLILDVIKFVFMHSIYKVVDIGEFRLALVFISLTVLTFYAARQTNKYIEKPGIKFGKRFIR